MLRSLLGSLWKGKMPRKYSMGCSSARKNSSTVLRKPLPEAEFVPPVAHQSYVSSKCLEDYLMTTIDTVFRGLSCDHARCTCGRRGAPSGRGSPPGCRDDDCDVVAGPGQRLQQSPLQIEIAGNKWVRTGNNSVQRQRATTTGKNGPGKHVQQSRLQAPNCLHQWKAHVSVRLESLCSFC